MVSRAVKLHEPIKKRLEELRFSNVSITALEKDGLNMLISDLKPDILMMSASFYHCSTPYMMGMLKRKFPKVYMSAFSISEYPVDLAMYFIINGAKAYVYAFDGLKEWYEGLDRIRAGKEYISPAIQERINMRSEYPMAARKVTDKQRELILLLCNGFKEKEIANTLHLSVRSVDTFKGRIFRSLNVRNVTELIRVALNIGIIKQAETIFSPRELFVNPKPPKEEIAKIILG